MKAQLSVGCAMWTHKAWQFSKLRGYAGWCDAVEGNTTFYATPSRATVQTWAAQTDPGFRFVIKLPRTITHERRLTGAEAELQAFLHAIEPLGPRVYALWLQLPGSFGPLDVPVLEGFLRSLPAQFRYAVEVRHRAFFDAPGALEGALESVGAEWIPFDTVTMFGKPPASDAEREAWTKKPRMPRRAVALTDRPIVRYLGRDDEAETVAGWQFWVDVVTRWLGEGRTPTVFIHTPDNAQAPALARRFHDEVRVRVPALEPLPSPLPSPPAGDEQPTLF